MNQWNVIWEINTENEDLVTPLDVAKYCTNIMRDANYDWQFYIQNDDTKEIFSVDLEEADENAVLPVKDYKPIIQSI